MRQFSPPQRNPSMAIQRRTRQALALVTALALLLGGLTAASAKVYRWVDEAGNVHFSDRPHEAAEEIEIQPQVPGGQNEPENGDATGDQQTAEEDTRPVVEAYSEIAITSPRRNQQLSSPQGALDVAVALTPELGRGHNVRLLIDGAEAIPPFPSAQARIDDIPAGSHTLMATVVNDAGDEMIRSSIINFFLRR